MKEKEPIQNANQRANSSRAQKLVAFLIMERTAKVLSPLPQGTRGHNHWEPSRDLTKARCTILEKYTGTPIQVYNKGDQVKQE